MSEVSPAKRLGCSEAPEPMTKAADAKRNKKEARHLVFAHSQHQKPGACFLCGLTLAARFSDCCLHGKCMLLWDWKASCWTALPGRFCALLDGNSAVESADG